VLYRLDNSLISIGKVSKSIEYRYVSDTDVI